MAEKRWDLFLSDGSDLFEFGALVVGKHVSELEHLRKFDTREKLEAELERLRAERKGKRAASA